MIFWHGSLFFFSFFFLESLKRITLINYYITENIKEKYCLNDMSKICYRKISGISSFKNVRYQKYAFCIV